MIAVAIAGVAGRMGQALVRAAAAGPDIHLIGGAEKPGSPNLGKDLAALAGLEPCGVVATDSVATASDGAHVWIDFTTPQATVGALQALAPSVRAVVIGTTGLSNEDQAAIAAHARQRAIVQSGNFSLGVAMLCALVRQAAQRLGPDWDIEIIEAHHRRKIDAPSGTALMVADAAANGRGISRASVQLAPRDGMTGPRPEGGIGMAVVRGGGIVGEHTALFAAEREVLTLSHSALDRSVFADGALAAARWAQSRPPGLYSLSDVLGL